MEELLFGLQEEEEENAVIPPPEFVFGSGSGLLDAADSEFIMPGPGADSEEASTIRAKIASHPLYPKLLQSYIDCRKVGAPPDVAEIFDEIRGERESGGGDASTTTAASVVLPSFGVDPDLDNFMESYCDILIKLKSDLCKPFDEATMFLDSMRTELSRLCTSDGGASETTCTFDDGAGSSEEDNMISVAVGDDEMEIISLERFRMNRDRELKDKLFQKYSGYISSLKHDFFKNKKNVKLPNHSRQILLNWWNLHYAWPYPTDSDKAVLAVATGLDPKQINNWFINQRKRHWKTPEENMQQQFTANNN